MQEASRIQQTENQHVLPGFNRFITSGLIAIILNIIDTVVSGYQNKHDVVILSVTAVVLVVSLFIYNRGFTLYAKLLSLFAFNVSFLLLSFYLGTRSATYLYYFPLMLVYIYLFRTEGKRQYIIIYTFITIVFLLGSLALGDGKFQFPVERISEGKHTFYLSFILSFSLTAYFFVQIYNYQERLYQRIIILENEQRKLELRSVIERQETDKQNIVYTLRDNINQTLAASKVYQGEAMVQKNNKAMLEKSYALTDEAIRDVSKLCMQLHPAVIADVGLVEGMNDYAASLEKLYKVQIIFTASDLQVETITLQDKISVFRMMQDYLDITMHYSAATKIKAELLYTVKKITIQLSQNDVHFNFMKQLKTQLQNSITNRLTYYSGSMEQLINDDSETIVIQLNIA